MSTGWWVHDYYQAGLVIVLLSHIFWVIFSICLHELAHGWAAIWQGDDTPIRSGHMNMNPLVHMGGASILAFLIIGIAWGAMPVDPSRFRSRRRGWVIVAGAGPAMNLLLALASILLLVFWMKLGPQNHVIYERLTTFFFVGAELNIVLMIFNLLPVPPLDGSAILSGLSFRWYRMLQQSNAQAIGMFIVLALMLSGFTRFMWAAGYHGAAELGDLLGSMLGNPPINSVLSYSP